MSITTTYIGVKNSKKMAQMRQIYSSCIDANVAIPNEVEKYLYNDGIVSLDDITTERFDNDSDEVFVEFIIKELIALDIETIRIIQS